MRKNRTKDVEVKWRIIHQGNWNFRNSDHVSMNTKPIAIVTLDQDEFVFCHADIMEIIKAYHEADKQSIAMIKGGIAGNVKNAEKPLLNKIADYIIELKNEDNGVSESRYKNLKDKGQMELR